MSREGGKAHIAFSRADPVQHGLSAVNIRNKHILLPAGGGGLSPPSERAIMVLHPSPNNPALAMEYYAIVYGRDAS
jgi:hypothetical protein